MKYKKKPLQNYSSLKSVVVGSGKNVLSADIDPH